MFEMIEIIADEVFECGRRVRRDRFERDLIERVFISRLRQDR
jgi:hypothetical protein